jgi:hypothetical protein
MQMDLPSKHVLHLSKRIGSRGAGTNGETAAASYVLRAFSELEIDTDVETFSSPRSDFITVAFLFMLTMAAYLCFKVSYALSFLLAGLVWLVFQMETYSWSVLSRLMPRSKAQNVIGTVSASGEAKHLVLLVANYDTARSSPLGRPGLARAFRFLYILSFICITITAALAVVGQGASLLKLSGRTIDFMWAICAPLQLFLLLLTALILTGELKSRYCAGANDNASGLGVMLSLVSSLADNPLENTTVWGVATARGFAGGRGMVALLKRHRRRLKNAFIINLDHLGGEPVRVITREGTMFGFRNSRKLSRLAFSAASKSRQLDVKKGKCRVKKSDAMVASVRGFEAITIGGTRGVTYTGWRNTADVSGTVNRTYLDRAVRLSQLIMESIDEMPGSLDAPRRRTRRAWARKPVLGVIEEESGPEERQPEP